MIKLTFLLTFLASTTREAIQRFRCSPKFTSHVKLPQFRDRSVFVNLSFGLRPLKHV